MTLETQLFESERFEYATDESIFAALFNSQGKAKAIAKRYGSFAEAAAKSPSVLMSEGLDAKDVKALKLMHAAAKRMIRLQIIRKPVLSSWTALIDYLTAAMACEVTEQFRTLFLDRKNVLIHEEISTRGTIDHTPVYPREICKRALQLDACAVIITHNHPSGDPTPSRADIEMTGQIKTALSALGIALHDHVVIGSKGHVSFKALGLI